MLITEPNDFVAEVHDRMPVVLESKDFASWLNDGIARDVPFVRYSPKSLSHRIFRAICSRFV
jgi:putative SOS response-associated peptidase YedK